MKISVVCPTYRVGGLDVLFEGLRGQTYRNFELVLVDGVPGRKDGFGLPIGYHLFNAVNCKVAFPDPNLFPVQSYCAYVNTGLRAASGDVCMLVGDYTWLPPDCLARHAAFHDANPSPLEGYMGPARNVAHPPVHPDFPRYSRDGIHSLGMYVEDLYAGRLDRFGYSIFAEPFHGVDARTLPSCPWLGSADPKLGMVSGQVDRHMLHLKNESWKMSRIREVGGLNEDMDGQSYWQDSELADALGLTWTLDSKNVAQIVNPRALFPLPRRTRPEGDNERVWQAGRGEKRWL